MSYYNNFSVYFSGKITNSVIVFLQKSNPQWTNFYEFTDLPTEFLRDPTCWLDAPKVELFLKQIVQEFSGHFPGENLIEKMGHECVDLRAWGVLDSVLRMMQKPQDIFTQPQRFISYFISPPPPIGLFEKTDNSAQFEIPISNEEYPYVTEYLRSALETLPTYMGHEMANAQWSGSKITVEWSKNQSSFFTESDNGHNVNPEFMRNLVTTLETKEKELAETKALLYQREIEIRKLKEQLNKPEASELVLKQLQELSEELKTVMAGFTEPIYQARQEFLRLNDYLNRAHQLVTVLIGQNRLSAPIQEALRRVDWDYVKSKFPKTVETGLNQLREANQSMQKIEKALKVINLSIDVNQQPSRNPKSNQQQIDLPMM